MVINKQWRFDRLALSAALVGLLGLAGCPTLPVIPATADQPSARDQPRAQRPVITAPARPRAQFPGNSTAQNPVPTQTRSDTGQSAQVFQAGRYEGPPRWGFDQDFAEKIARLRVFVSGSSEQRDMRVSGDTRQLLTMYPLSLARQSTITFRDVMAQQAVPATLLDCEYRRTQRTASEANDKDFKPEAIKIFYWQAGTRQALSAKMLQPYQNRSDQIADVERDSCPPDFASALTAGFGEAAWVEKAQLAVSGRQKTVRDNIETGIWNPVDYKDWASNAKSLSPAEDRALARELNQEISRLEAQGKVPNADDYYKTLNQKLQPAMAKLAASGVAKAQAISRGAAGRPAFEQWDAGIGHTVVSLAMRVHRWKQPGNLFIGVLGQYQILYAEQIGDKGSLEPQYMGKMLQSIAQYKISQAANRTPDPSPEYQRSAGVMVMRPRQSALYRMTEKGVQLAQALGEGRAKIARYLNDTERDIIQTRQDFWACYAQRCPQGGVLYYKFSALLNDLDGFRIGNFAMEAMMNKAYGNAQVGPMFLDLFGANRKINDVYVGACDYQWDRFIGQFASLLTQNPTTMVQRLEEALAGDDYLKLQQCRDQMEFIMRPRSGQASLL